MEWAMFNLLHAVEEIATAMMPDEKKGERYDRRTHADSYGVDSPSNA